MDVDDAVLFQRAEVNRLFAQAGEFMHLHAGAADQIDALQRFSAQHSAVVTRGTIVSRAGNAFNIFFATFLLQKRCAAPHISLA